MHTLAKPGFLYPRTPDIYTLVPRIFILSYPPSYREYAYPHTPGIHILVPLIFIPSYPAYSYSRTPDTHTLVPWIFSPTLTLQGDMYRRAQRLTDEANRVEENKTLTPTEKRRLLVEKHCAILRPIAVGLDRVRKETFSRTPETSHERWFVSTFAPQIDRALLELRSPTR